MEAVAWKSSRDESGYKYNIQIDKIKGKRNENKIRKLMDGWTIYAEGFNIKEKEVILGFSRKFESSRDWLIWAKTFPYRLLEETKRGTKTLVKANKNN